MRFSLVERIKNICAINDSPASLVDGHDHILVVQLRLLIKRSEFYFLLALGLEVYEPVYFVN